MTFFRSALVSLILSAAITSIVAAEIPDKVARSAQERTFSQWRPTVVIGEETGGGAWSLSSVFYRTYANSRPDATNHRWLIRRETGRLEEFSQHVEWADSVTCPQMEPVLAALASVSIPSPRVPGIVVDQNFNEGRIPVDGALFTIWTASVDRNGAPGVLRYSSLGGDLLEWGVAANMQLESCWSENTPTDF